MVKSTRFVSGSTTTTTLKFCFGVFFLCTLMTMALTVPETRKNHYDEDQPCSDNSECPFSHCCKVGMMRYSVPVCIPLGQLEDPCIPLNQPDNFSLTMPNVNKGNLEVTNSYRLYCPCSPDLVCDPKSASCSKSA